MWSGLLVHLPSSPDGSKPNAPTRVEICPPALPRSTRGWRQRLLDWLAGSWPEAEADVAAAIRADEAEPPLDDPLDIVRLEFSEAVGDMATPQAAELARRIQGARSLRELWHFRTEVFNMVSRHCGQREATARLQKLNRHFPARAPRSGFGGFDAEPHMHLRR